MFAVRRTKFSFMVLVIVLNRLLGEVGVGVRDFEALPLNFPFPVCLHFLTPFPFIFYPISSVHSYVLLSIFPFKLRVFTSCRIVNFQPNHDGT